MKNSLLKNRLQCRPQSPCGGNYLGIIKTFIDSVVLYSLSLNWQMHYKHIRLRYSRDKRTRQNIHSLGFPCLLVVCWTTPRWRGRTMTEIEEEQRKGMGMQLSYHNDERGDHIQNSLRWTELWEGKISLDPCFARKVPCTSKSGKLQKCWLASMDKIGQKSMYWSPQKSTKSTVPKLWKYFSC